MVGGYYAVRERGRGRAGVLARAGGDGGRGAFLVTAGLRLWAHGSGTAIRSARYSAESERS